MDKQECKKVAREKHLAACFLRRANREIYGPLLRELRDQRVHGVDLHPQTLSDAYTLLENHSSGRQRFHHTNDRARHREGNTSQGIQYAQRGERGKASGPPVAGLDGRFIRSKQCYNCYRYGHYSDNCPNGEIEERQQHHIQGAVIEEKSDSEEDDSVIISFTYMTDARSHGVDRNSILLDTGSNCSVFNNIHMLTDVKKSRKKLCALTNGGSQESEYRGTLPGFFEVWYNPHSMVNILSFGEVAQRFRITMDTANENTINVHINQDDDKVLKFREMDNGLYVLETTNNDLVSHYSYLHLATLPNHNHAYYSKSEIAGAEQAMDLYNHINVTRYGNFIKLLERNYFRDCPITAEDAKRALELYGRNESEVQGRTTRKRPLPIEECNIVSLPDNIKDRHRSISLSVDYLYINGMPMLHSISGRSYQFLTLEPLYKAKPNKEDMIDGLQHIIKTYKARGIEINQINADNEFACVSTEMLPARMNIMAADEHVGDVERSIRYIKEGTRTQIQGLPLTHYTNKMTAGCVMYVLKHINHLPSRSRLSTELSPATLVTGDPTPLRPYSLRQDH